MEKNCVQYFITKLFRIFLGTTKTQEGVKPPYLKGLGVSCLKVVLNHQNPMYESHLEFCILSHFFQTSQNNCPVVIPVGTGKYSLALHTNQQTKDEQPKNQSNIEPIQISCWTGKHLEIWRLAIIIPIAKRSLREEKLQFPKACDASNLCIW